MKENLGANFLSRTAPPELRVSMKDISTDEKLFVVLKGPQNERANEDWERELVMIKQYLLARHTPEGTIINERKVFILKQ